MASLRRLLMGSVFIGAVASGQAVFAQQDAAAAKDVAQDGTASEAAGYGVGEIVVTARRRAESLQNTPVAVSAITSAVLEEKGATNIAAVAQSVPSLTFNTTAGNSGASNAAVVFIRGIGQDDFFPTIDPGVGIYLDGVYVSRTLGGVLDTVDLEQVEVLRGPQGTLFGKNTIGGAVQITTKKPGPDLQGSLEATTGRFSRADVKASVNLPLSDTLFTRFSIASLNRNGYITILAKNPVTGAVSRSDAPRLGDISTMAGRAALRWKASPDLTVDLAADYTRKREQSSGSTLLATQPVIPGLGFNPADPASINNYIFANANTVGGFHNLIVAGAQDCNPVFGGNPLDQNNPACFNNQYVTGNPYTTFYEPNASRSDLDVWGLTGVVDWEAMPGLGVKSITAYRNTKSFFMRDDGTPFQLIELQTDQTAKQFSEELQFSGKAFDDRLTWLLGLFYLNEKVDFDNPACFSFVCTGVSTRLETNSYAAFAQGSYAVGPATNITLGARYTNEKKTSDPNNVFIDIGFGLGPLAIGNPNANPATIINTPVAVKFDNVSPMASIDHRWSRNVMTYASYSKGVKGGGFQQRVIVPRILQPTFGPEKLTAYEVGAKTDFFDRRLRVNVAAFQSDYKDLQVTTFPGGANSIEPVQVNGGKARIRGVEVEATAHPIEPLTANFGLSYLDTEYLKIAPGAVIPANARLPFTPKWSLSGGLAYRFEIGSAGDLTLRGDWNYRTETFLSADNTPILRQPGYHMVNVLATFETASKAVRVTGGITNLTDKAVLMSGFADLQGSSLADGTYGRPREWYLSIRYSY
ncbi:TonB-dependent receptor [Rhizorhabdus dicambivorans]|uniref:TonB-dependent receptor n=2 Tax=Rhizorhabdus dicambivorans TaxID=1850238 RepID=A0A2A4FZA5_9SPHN|nr:TonB-dependent receptor [Rhizorhabdus dicambivorans]PCE42762.1 TonB-dependent receptor [Rhizorhabdus dicambivorans]